MPDPLRLIIDTDTAGDDVSAIVLALRTPGVRVEGLTIVAGNVPFDQQVENALYTVEQTGWAGRVPVYPGCRRPLRRALRHVTEIQGEDGMGNAFFPQARHRPETEHAVDFLIRTLRANPGAITLVMLGPLTNLAVALDRAPDIAGLPRRVVVMGGAVFGQGNVTPAAEYNIWTDPEAAERVFRAGLPLWLVSWEMALRHGRLDPGRLRALDTPLGGFLLQVLGVALSYDTIHGGVGTLHPDALTMAIALDPGVATDVRRRHVAVGTETEAMRGVTLVDHDGSGDRAPNADVVYAADGARFEALLCAALGDTGGRTVVA